MADANQLLGIFGDEPHFHIVVVVVVVVVAFVGVLMKSVKPGKKIALNPEEWRAFPLIDVKKESHDVRRFRFALPTKEHIVGLPIGQHISLKYVDEEGKEVQRSYTPVTSDDEAGYVDFVIKVYFRDVHPRFPNGGKMSQHLESLKIGDTILMKGPKGHLDYKGQGNFTIKQKREIVPYKKKKIGMVAGGTGITPMLQVIRAILKDPADDTELWLMFGNQTEEDILLRKELESIPNNRFHLFYTLDRPPVGWTFGTGFVTQQMCQEHLPQPADDVMIFMCGPPMMMKSIEAHLEALGFEQSQFFSF